MPISTQCPYCRKKFRAADKVAGKAVKCPGCQGVVRVPAAQSSEGNGPGGGQAQPLDLSWYILSENGEKMGPVSKEQLDNLATKGRLSFCKVRRSDWQGWKWPTTSIRSCRHRSGRASRPIPSPLPRRRIRRDW